jgi:cell wall-associated NlpC family hydrolase
MSLTLAACATTSHETPHPLHIEPAPTTEIPVPQKSAATRVMIDSATSMIGQPYRFGGAAPGGFDCSGSPVRRAELQAGDLVFMHLSSKELHVAIALDGQLFVHAPSSGGRVRVDSLLARPYAKAFVAARRVVSFDTPH